MAHLSRIQVPLDTRGLTGGEPRLKPLLRAVAEALQAQDLAAVNVACDAVVDAASETVGGG